MSTIAPSSSSPSAAATPTRPTSKKGRPKLPAGKSRTAHEDPAATLTAAAARSRWAQLLARIYDLFPLPARTADRSCAFSPSSPTPNPSAPSSATSTSLALRLGSRPPGSAQGALELDTDPVAPVDPLPADGFDETPAID